MLTAAQQAARAGELTASRAGVLMSGDDAALYDLWREITGDPGYEPPDLSGVWAVQLGSHTESLNLDWYERKTGNLVTRRGEAVTSQERDWAAATLDGWDTKLVCPVEAKHVGGFERLETVVARYVPQLHWQMYCTGADVAVLSVIVGAKEPVLEEVRRDEGYLAELLRRADAFWECVETLTPPVALPAMEAPKPAVREVDMSVSNAWGYFAADWLANRDAAKRFRIVDKELKALTPGDAKRAYGHGIQATRARNGAVTIREAAQ